MVALRSPKYKCSTMDPVHSNEFTNGELYSSNGQKSGALKNGKYTVEQWKKLRQRRPVVPATLTALLEAPVVSDLHIDGLNSNDTSPSSASTPASLSACSMDDIRPVKRCKSLTDMPDRQLIDKRRKRHKMTPVYYHTLLNNYELKVELAVKKEVALEKALKECEHAIESIPNYSQSPPTSMPWSTATPPCYSAPSSAIWTEPGMNDYFNLSEKPTSNYLPFSATDNYGFGKETYSTCTPTADSPVDYMQNHHQLEDLQQEQYLPSTTYSPIREPHYSVPCTAVDMGTLSSPQGHSNSSIPETYGQSTEHIPDLYNSLFPY